MEEGLALSVHLLGEFITTLNPLIAPTELYDFGTSEDEPPKAIVISRGFECAKLIVNPGDILITVSSHPHTCTHYDYADPGLLDQLVTRLRFVADNVPTPGWSDQEMYLWEYRGIEEMERIWAGARRSGALSRQILLQRYGISSHSDCHRADRSARGSRR